MNESQNKKRHSKDLSTLSIYNISKSNLKPILSKSPNLFLSTSLFSCSPKEFTLQDFLLETKLALLPSDQLRLSSLFKISA